MTHELVALSLGEAAVLLHVDRRVALRALGPGQLKKARSGGLWRISRPSLEAPLTTHSEQAGTH